MKMMKFILTEIILLQRIIRCDEDLVVPAVEKPISEEKEFNINIEIPIDWGSSEVFQHQIKTTSFRSKTL